MDIPILIICYNNYKYVKNTMRQIKLINQNYYKNIHIVNNNSTCSDTIAFLQSVNEDGDVKIINNYENGGPWITPWNNCHIYSDLPEKYILTDPDLELNSNIPTNFIEILAELSDKYKSGKVGFALDINDFDKMYQCGYVFKSEINSFITIYKHEIQYWENKINDDQYTLYYANLDTTFCLINKKYDYYVNDIRVAGNFTAKHLPWYIDNKIYNPYQKYKYYSNNNISTMSKIFINHITTNYLILNKNDELILIKKDENDMNISFWEKIFSGWKSELFYILNKYLKKDKIFIDIGGWIGTTAIYGSRKSKHVYSIEADIQSFHDMKNNLGINCDDNYTLINNVMYNIDNIDIAFGKNRFLKDSRFNDSTSQIHGVEDAIDQNNYLLKTINIKSMINKYNIDCKTISLINVDIEGGEEHILNDLNDIRIFYNIPMYISFHYDWWKNKDLNRFEFLSEENKNDILLHPFTSILFDDTI